MKASFTRGTKVLIAQKAKVHPEFIGKRGYIIKANYSSDKGYLLKVKIGDEFDQDCTLADLVATEDDVIILDD